MYIKILNIYIGTMCSPIYGTQNFSTGLYQNKINRIIFYKLVVYKYTFIDKFQNFYYFGMCMHSDFKLQRIIQAT